MVMLVEKSHAELIQTVQDQGDKIVQLEAKINWFEEQHRLALHKKFGVSSEQSHLAQEALLFNEAEANAIVDLPEPPVEVITSARHKTKGLRKAQLDALPFENIEYRLPEERQVCPGCDNALHEMGNEVRREIKIIPAQVSVVNHIRFKYACRHCQVEETTTPILNAPMPKPAFVGSAASAAAVAHIMTQKFVMAAPLYRQEQQFKRDGIEISRQTMANWIIRGAKWLEPLYDRMHELMLERDIAQADETTLQVLKEQGRAATTDSYMWNYHTGRVGPPIVLFEYQPTRAGEHPKTFLAGFEGYLQTDGFPGYGNVENVVRVGCWAHARRKFDEAIKALPPARKDQVPPTAAQTGLKFCNALFKIERELHDCTPEQRFAARNEKSKPVLDAFKVWLDEQAPKVLPKSALGAAVTYARNQWGTLNTFLLDGRLEIDNNRSERAIKPFVIGRKNWLFANTPKGAKASATIYSIIETAKENGINPFKYLEYLFETMPNVDNDDSRSLDAILPWTDAVQAKCAVPTRR